MAYVYRHIRLDTNMPFYIGIGTDSAYKRANEKTRRSEYWKRIALKHGFEVEIMMDDITRQQAKEKEIEFIKLYGRVDIGTGILCNMTAGGDGTFDKVFTPEYRRRLSESAKKRGPQPQLQKIIEYRKNVFQFTDEIRKKLSIANKGRKLGEKQIEQLKQRKGEANPMFGKSNYNYLGDVAAYKNGEQIGVFHGVHGAAKNLNVSATKISACLNGRRKTTGGYEYKRIWKGQIL